MGNCGRLHSSVEHRDHPGLVSHETVCILNTGDSEAHVEITVYFAEREPAGPYRLTVPARRTRHVRFNDLKDPEPIPADTDYSSVIVSSVPIVVNIRGSTRASLRSLF